MTRAEILRLAIILGTVVSGGVWYGTRPHPTIPDKRILCAEVPHYADATTWDGLNVNQPPAEEGTDRCIAPSGAYRLNTRSALLLNAIAEWPTQTAAQCSIVRWLVEFNDNAEATDDDTPPPLPHDAATILCGPTPPAVLHPERIPLDAQGVQIYRQWRTKPYTPVGGWTLPFSIRPVDLPAVQTRLNECACRSIPDAGPCREYLPDGGLYQVKTGVVLQPTPGFVGTGCIKMPCGGEAQAVAQRLGADSTMPSNCKR